MKFNLKWSFPCHDFFDPPIQFGEGETVESLFHSFGVLVVKERAWSPNLNSGYNNW